MNNNATHRNSGILPLPHPGCSGHLSLPNTTWNLPNISSCLKTPVTNLLPYSQPWRELTVPLPLGSTVPCALLPQHPEDLSFTALPPQLYCEHPKDQTLLICMFPVSGTAPSTQHTLNAYYASMQWEVLMPCSGRRDNGLGGLGLWTGGGPVCEQKANTRPRVRRVQNVIIWAIIYTEIHKGMQTVYILWWRPWEKWLTLLTKLYYHFNMCAM